MAIRIINRQKKIKLNLKRIRHSLVNILRELECSERELNILFTDDPGIQVMNHQYLGKDKPTNVISFSGNDGVFHESENILGDIVISVETALKDGIKGGLSIDHEIDYLMIHGILHLLGYDHVTTRIEARRMAAKERELFYILNGFKVG